LPNLLQVDAAIPAAAVKETQGADGLFPFGGNFETGAGNYQHSSIKGEIRLNTGAAGQSMPTSTLRDFFGRRAKIDVAGICQRKVVRAGINRPRRESPLRSASGGA
jgi:hypothetical protein